MKRRNLGASPVRQSGAALAVVLLMLIVVTLIGLASLRGTLLQERMSASAFDVRASFLFDRNLRTAGRMKKKMKRVDTPKTAS